MRAWISFFVVGTLSACGPSAKETPREPHGGEQAKVDPDGNATVACATPQLNLNGVIAGLKYQRTVNCSDVNASGLETVGEEQTFNLRATGSRSDYVSLRFRGEATEVEPYTGAVQVVLRIPDDADLGNCPSDEFPSTAHLEGAAGGTFDFVDVHYLNGDGSCGAAVAGEIHGFWTTKP